MNIQNEIFIYKATKMYTRNINVDDLIPGYP